MQKVHPEIGLPRAMYSKVPWTKVLEEKDPMPTIREIPKS